MISRRQLPELRTFKRAEVGLPLRATPEYAPLVVPSGNSNRAVHHWFKYKEAFSGDLLQHVLKDFITGSRLPSTLRLLDPFCGVGTALLSAQLLDPSCRVEAIGIDCNPFSAFVARSKTSWPQVDPKKLRSYASRILAFAAHSSPPLPGLSSIRTGRCISRYMAKQIVLVRSQIERLRSSPERDVLLTGLAACIEPVSKIRRDGRALRLVSRPRKVLRKLLAVRWESMARDIEELQRSHKKPPSVNVYCGDGRMPASTGIAEASIDLIVTSPPYPNNIDYNEVYKLELWLLGFASTAEGFLRLRRQTYRSHPTCSPIVGSEHLARFQGMLEDGPLAELLGVVSRRVHTMDREGSRGRSRVLLGYAHDTWLTLLSHRLMLKSGGRAIYVVGNSLHGGPGSRPYLIPTDLIFSCLARMVGLKVEHVIVARPLSRRLSGNHFLRDSLVVLRKP